MLWVKVFHVFFIVTWFAGLLYLPRLFVYHAMANDAPSIERFKIMERKLYFGIATPGACFTILFGIWLLLFNVHAYLHMGWMHVKLTTVLLLICYHLYCGKILFAFKNDRNRHSHRFYRILNEIPAVFLFIILALVIVKPF